MARAGLEAAFGAVVGPVLGRGDHGQVSDFDAAHVAAPGVVHIFPDLMHRPRCAAMTTLVARTWAPGIFYARALPAGGQRGNQAAVVVTVGASQDSCGDVGQDRDSGSVLQTLSRGTGSLPNTAAPPVTAERPCPAPRASRPARGPQGLPANCLENACKGSNTELKAQRNHLWEVIQRSFKS
jgi:hypothetical protein